MPKQQYICLDIESDSPKPFDENCNPVQISAMVLDYHSLEEVPNSRFNSGIRPEGLETEKYYNEHSSTLQWHCKVKGCTWDKLKATWAEFPEEKQVWKSFYQYVNKYNVAKGIWGAPVPVGANIEGFDLPVLERVAKKHGNDLSKMLYMRDSVNVQFLCYQWLHNKKDAPKNYKMDTLRDYFMMSNEGAHDAMFDVISTAAIFRRFWKWQRQVAEKANFRVKINM